MRTVGLLHPGEMGASIGATLRRAGVQVLWVSAGRGPATRRRAQAADLTDAGALSALVARSDALLSVCPPHAAVQVAHPVAKSGFTGIYVDANAVAPATARAFSAVVERAGGRFVPCKEFEGDPPLGEVLKFVRAARDSTPRPPGP
jgi:3-hydroxyisobutyrate dehydrogenase-like beta-hydroxyacid dehydrogenase